MKDFTFLILLILVAFCSFVSGVITKYRSYKENGLYTTYSDLAILMEAIKNEATIQYKVLLVFIPITFIIDLIIIWFK